MNPSISQGVMMAQRAQAAPTAGVWSYASNGRCSLSMTTGAPNYSNMFPGTQDFCWETWVFPISRFAFSNNWMITAWGSGGNPGGPQASNFSLYFSIDNLGSLCGVKINAIGSFSTTITAVAEANIFSSTWHHVAMSRSGTTISAWLDGVLYAQITDFTGDLSYANVGGEAYWIGGGPTSDRDAEYIDCMEARYRNTRYTIGNSVYPDSYNITPPSLYDQIPAVTGTQWVWWPNNTTNAFFSPYDAPWIPDINPGSYQFTSLAGDSSGPDICPVGMATPDNYNTTPVPYGPIGSDEVGTWTNNGTVGSQPVITTAGPAPIIGTACADFTKTGTDVRISSTTSRLMYWGSSFFLTMWVYVPANITNESKTIIACAGGTDNFVLNIGRPGQGLDWLSVYYSNDTEVAYAPHIWARNAWNYITVNQQTVLGGGVGPIYAWAGAYGDSYAVNLNLTNAFTPAFGNGSSVSIGCKAGSSVSCQMYINLIQQTSGYTNNGNMNVYSGSQATIPMQTWQYRKLLLGETFTFQGTNGATNIQPINVTGT